MVGTVFGTILVGALIGLAAERLRMTRNGYVVSIALGVGGAMLLWFVQYVFGIRLGVNRALVSALGAVVLLFLAGRRR